MIKWIRQLFCKHQWNVRATDRVERDLLHYTSFKICSKCHKFKYFFTKDGFNTDLVVIDEVIHNDTN